MTNHLLTDLFVFCYLPSMVICILIWIRSHISDIEDGSVNSQSFSTNIFICLCPVLNSIVLIYLATKEIQYYINKK